MGSFLSGLLRWKAIVTIVGLVAVSLLIWFLGPLIGIGESQPLESAVVRIVLIAILLLGVLAIAVGRHWVARRANTQLINSLVESEELVSMAETQASEEVALIRERFEDAFDALRSVEMRKKGGRAFVSQLPWYIIIGPPGAGKTTILQNSGLEFPLAERLGQEAIQGVGGTRNCDWWFTDEAVLIDTAGRYSTQDVNTEVDRAAWKGFLDLLKRHRRRRPINGVMLAISLSDVLLSPEMERKRHAAALKKRLQELMRAFGVRVPVYVLLTKADLIAGFNEYFETLDEGGREQVWGMTLPLDGSEARLAEEFTTHYAALADRLHDGAFERMHEERDISRRCKIFTFPQEFASLQPVVGAFINDIFRPNRYEMQPILRGIYFTSGTQEGAPIHRLLSAMSRTFGFAAGSLVPYAGRGKAYFIKKLLTDVVFEEQGLVGGNRKLERHVAAMHGMAYAATAALVIGLGALWLGGLARGEAQASATASASAGVDEALGEYTRSPSLTNALPVVEASGRVLEINSGSSLWSWLESFGVSATSRLAPEARALHDRMLTGVLLPEVAGRFDNRLAAAASDPDFDPARLRDLLRNYLMLGDSEHFEAEPVLAAAEAESAAVFGMDVDRREALNGRMQELVALLPSPTELNARTVDSARSRLARVPQSDQVYARLVSEAGRSLQPLDLSRVIGADALGVRMSSGGETSVGAIVPGLYTRQGFLSYVLTSLPRIVRDEQGSDWVVAGGTVEDASFQRVVTDVSQRYARDYIAAWQSALTRIGVQSMTDLARGQSVLQSLAGPDAPLIRLLETVHENTHLPQPGSSEGEAGDGQGAGAGGMVASAVQSAAGGAMSAALGDVPWPGTPITAAFRGLHDLTVGSQDQGPGVQRVQQLFGDLYGTVNGVASAPSPPSAAFQFVSQAIAGGDTDAMSRLRTDSALRPEPVRTIMRDVADGTWTLLMGQTYRHVNQSWQREVLPVCDSALFQRYPLNASSSEEISLQDFSEFFRPGGTVDAFHDGYLAPFLTVQGGRLTQASIGGVTLGLSEDTLSQIRRAQFISNAFFPDGGSAPAVSFSITPVALAPQALRATFTLDDRTVVYRHEPPRPHDLQWPSRAESSTASIAVTMIDGTNFSVERTGIWALFRLLREGGLSQVSSDRYRVTLANQEGVGVSYDIRAASVSNAFSPGLLPSFRCPASL